MRQSYRKPLKVDTRLAQAGIRSGTPVRLNLTTWARIRHLALVCCVTLAQLGAGGCSDREPGAAGTAHGRDWPSGHSHSDAKEFRSLIDTLQLSGIDVIWLADETGAEIGLMAEIDATQLSPNLIAAPGTGISVTEAMTREDRKVIVGSGFISEADTFKPVGLLKVEGSELSPLEPYGYTRILGFDETGFAVVHRKDYDPTLFSSALQAGPGIVEQGLLDISVRDLQRPTYYRSFVVLCADRMRIGVSTSPVHLHTLGKALVRFSELHRLNCPEVINLAGDTQAVFAIRNEDGFIYHGDINSRKVTLLSFNEDE